MGADTPGARLIVTVTPDIDVLVRLPVPPLTVTVRDAQGQTVRRLAYKTPSRPLGLGSEASLF